MLVDFSSVETFFCLLLVIHGWHCLNSFCFLSIFFLLVSLSSLLLTVFVFFSIGCLKSLLVRDWFFSFLVGESREKRISYNGYKFFLMCVFIFKFRAVINIVVETNAFFMQIHWREIKKLFHVLVIC